MKNAVHSSAEGIGAAVDGATPTPTSGRRGKRSTVSPLERGLLMGTSWLVAILFAFLPLSKLPPTPPDLAQFYFAGRLVAAGQSAELYNPAAYAPLAEELAATGKPISQFHFYNRPAFGALPWAVIAQLPYATVEKLVIFGNMLGILLLAWKLPEWFPRLRSFRPWLLCYPPFMWSVQFGQDTVFIAWAVAYSFVLIRDGREKRAGLLLSLCLVKPHLVWLLPVAFFFCKRRTAAYSFAASGLVLAAVSFLLVGVDGVGDWYALLGAKTTDHGPETMATLRAIGLYVHPLVGIAAGVGVVIALALACREREIERALPIAIVASVLLSPHAYVQDASVFVAAAGFLGSGLLTAVMLLPWPELTILIHHSAFPFSYVAIGLAMIAYFAFRRRPDAEVESPELAASGGDRR